MEILNYNTFNVQKYNINKVIDNILYKNLNYDENDKYIYYLLQKIELNKSKEKKEDNIYIKYEKKLQYKNIILPGIKLSKLIIIYDKENKKYKLLSFENELNITLLNYLINYTKNLKYVLGILNNIVIYIIKNKGSDKLIIKEILKIIDKILLYIYIINNNISIVKLIIKKFNKRDELKLLLEIELKIIKEEIIQLEKNLNITRTNIIQKITLNEMHLQRLLTNVATIILPLSLIIGIFSLPYKNIPFKDNDNGLIILILILLIIGYILYYLINKYKYELL
tara:strand:- start:5291 stop:6133 length:843 start_codon:yes stop_codon:yes gene_type:complete